MKIGDPVQVPLFGPNSLNVIEPDGLPPVVSVALSAIELPSVVAAGVTCVVSVVAHGPLPGSAGALRPSTLMV